MDMVDNKPNLETYTLIPGLLEKVKHKSVLVKTIETIAHCQAVILDWLNSGPEQEEYGDS